MDNISVKNIEHCLEQCAQQFEKSHGLKTITQDIRELEKQFNTLDYITEYRKIIRNNTWSFQKENLSPDRSLLRRWSYSSKFYVQNAIRLYEFITSNINGKSFSQIHQDALLSETVRGRDGKSSPIGLDKTQDMYIEQLESLAFSIHGRDEHEIQQCLDTIIGVLAPPYINAENEMYFQFYKYKQSVGRILTPDNLEIYNKDTNGLVSRILRNYCRYSIDNFNKKYDLLDLNREKLEIRKNNLKQLASDREQAVTEIANVLRTTDLLQSIKFVNLSHQINDLNYLNTNVEVKYNFKSWPGFFHHIIFQMGMDSSPADDIHHRQSELHLNTMVDNYEYQTR